MRTKPYHWMFVAAGLMVLLTSVPVWGQDAELPENADAIMAEGDQLYAEGRFLEAALTWGQVADINTWYSNAGAKQILALVQDSVQQDSSVASVEDGLSSLELLEGIEFTEAWASEIDAVRQRLQQMLALEPSEPPVEQATAALPTQVATEVPAPEATEVPTVAPSEEPTPVPTPVPTVVPTPVPQRPAEPSPQPQAASSTQAGDIVDLTAEVERPRLTRRVAPIYPAAARRMRVRGVVRLQALVGTDGTVEELRILQIPREGLGFERAVEDAVTKWRFEPATRNGVPVRVWLPIVIPFQ